MGRMLGSRDKSPGVHLQPYKSAFSTWGREFCINYSLVNRQFFNGERFYYGPHMHEDFFDWIFVVEGRLHETVNGRGYRLGPGDMIWIRKGDWHEEFGEHLRFFVLYGTADWLESAMAFFQTTDMYRALLALPDPPVCHVPETRRANVTRQWEQCHNLQLTNLGKIHVMRMLSDLFVEYFSPLVAKVSSPKHLPDWLRRGLEFVERHLMEGMTTENLAEACEKSPEYLARSFQRYLGMTPSHYINQQKLNYAAHLLCTTERSILDIALMANFNSQSYFNRLFRDRFYCSPRAYRERHWKSVKDIKDG